MRLPSLTTTPLPLKNAWMAHIILFLVRTSLEHRPAAIRSIHGRSSVASLRLSEPPMTVPKVANRGNWDGPLSGYIGTQPSFRTRNRNRL